MNAQEVYEQIEALAGQESVAHPGRPVWVPAVANGGLRQLVEELAARGFYVQTPEERIASAHEAGALLIDFGLPSTLLLGIHEVCDGQCVYCQRNKK